MPELTVKQWRVQELVRQTDAPTVPWEEARMRIASA